MLDDSWINKLGPEETAAALESLATFGAMTAKEATTIHRLAAGVKGQGRRTVALQAGARLVNRRLHCATAFPIFAPFLFQTEAAWLALVCRG
jgi:hypothetical protein